MTLFPVYGLHCEPLVATVVLGVLAVVVASRWGSSTLASLRRAAGGPRSATGPEGSKTHGRGGHIALGVALGPALGYAVGQTLGDPDAALLTAGIDLQREAVKSARSSHTLQLDTFTHLTFQVGFLRRSRQMPGCAHAYVASIAPLEATTLPHGAPMAMFSAMPGTWFERWTLVRDGARLPFAVAFTPTRTAAPICPPR